FRMDIAKDVPEAGERGKAQLAARLYIDAPQNRSRERKTHHDGA
ncbi:hypothetical protein SEE30663_00272, partial [Salmonella enterica subsp. enterica serovar Enteritidis str. SE30663]